MTKINDIPNCKFERGQVWKNPDDRLMMVVHVHHGADNNFTVDYISDDGSKGFFCEKHEYILNNIKLIASLAPAPKAAEDFKPATGNEYITPACKHEKGQYCVWCVGGKKDPREIGLDPVKIQRQRERDKVALETILTTAHAQLNTPTPPNAALDALKQAEEAITGKELAGIPVDLAKRIVTLKKWAQEVSAASSAPVVEVDLPDLLIVMREIEDYSPETKAGFLWSRYTLTKK